jgi:hypothetical protein
VERARSAPPPCPRMYVRHVVTGIASMCHRGNHAGNAEARLSPPCRRRPPPPLPPALPPSHPPPRTPAFRPETKALWRATMSPPGEFSLALSLLLLLHLLLLLLFLILLQLYSYRWRSLVLISSRAGFVKSRNSLRPPLPRPFFLIPVSC